MGFTLAVGFYRITTRLKQDAHLYSLLQIIKNKSKCVTTK